MKKLFLVLFCLINISAFAQFAIPVKKISMNKEGYVVKNDGTKVNGKVVGAWFSGVFLKSVTLKTEKGAKVKFKAEDIQEFGEKLGKMSKFETFTESTGNMRFSTKDVEKLLNKEWVYFFSGSKKAKKDKPRLLQLLNPGWAQPIQVFVDPKAKKTMGLTIGGMAVVGGRAKSYLLIKDGRTIELKKGKYKKIATDLFGDCKEFQKEFPELKWRDLPMHIFTYNKLKGKI